MDAIIGVPADGMLPGSPQVLAVSLSTTIFANDVNSDPVHYKLGMWGKVIILGVIKHYGTVNNVNPEVDIHGLNWNVIYPMIMEKIPSEHLDKVTLEGCKTWFENRMNIYRRCYPDYHQKVSAIDELLRYYAIEMTSIQYSLGFSTYCWQNFCMDQGGQNISFPAAYCIFPDRDIATNNGRNSPVNLNAEEPSLVIPLHSADFEEFNGAEVDFSLVEDNPLEFEAANNAEVASIMMDFDVIQSGPNDISTSPPPPVSSINTECGFDTTLDSSKTALLQLVDSLMAEQSGLLLTMSNSLKLMAKDSDVDQCDYTLENLKAKIERGEIQSEEDVYYFCRCIIGFYNACWSDKIDLETKEFLKSIQSRCT